MLPWNHCGAAQANHQISGATLSIEASGTVKETIEEGAYVKLVVKYGYIKLLDQTMDLCEQIKNVDLECPIEKGKISITRTSTCPRRSLRYGYQPSGFVGSR